MKVFNYPLLGMEVDEYINDLVGEYGETHEMVSLLDKNYDILVKNHHIWVVSLNAIRKFLIENGFSIQIEKEDIRFSKKIEKELSVINKFSGLTEWETREKNVLVKYKKYKNKIRFLDEDLKYLELLKSKYN